MRNHSLYPVGLALAHITVLVLLQRPSTRIRASFGSLYGMRWLFPSSSVLMTLTKALKERLIWLILGRGLLILMDSCCDIMGSVFLNSLYCYPLPQEGIPVMLPILSSCLLVSTLLPILRKISTSCWRLQKPPMIWIPINLDKPRWSKENFI